MTAAATAEADDKAFFGHPKALGFLAFTEAWERFSYYGMVALLVLYMSKQLLLPGHVENIVGFEGARWLVEHTYGGGKTMTVVALASGIYGFYSSTVYLTPFFGGLLADWVLGRTRTVVLGAFLMAAVSTSASAKTLRRPCAQQLASRAGAGLRSGAERSPKPA